jgi:signal transduction histidine kinase
MPMSIITLTWTIIPTVALTLALFCAVAWSLQRRNLGYLMFCLIAAATAACAPFELGMMHSATPAEYGAWLQAYHLPIFLVLVGQLLFIHFYLGTGRVWLLYTIVLWRAGILVTNFLVEPNFHFHEIAALGHAWFLGEPISVVASGSVRSWQWLANASMAALVIYLVDASLGCWRRGDRESRRKAAVVGLGIGVPMICNLVINQLALFGIIPRPLFATIWFLGTLAAVAYELGRELILNARARVQVAQLRGELAQLGRVDTMGQLASGLAHELAQPLTASLGNIEAGQLHLKNDRPDLGELKEIIDAILHDTNRAAEMLDRMRKLIRRQPVDKLPVPVDEVFRDVSSLLHSEVIARRVELAFRVAPNLPRALGDRVQISQVILNLIVNSMDAMQAAEVTRRELLVEAQSPERGILEITVTDTGPGIPPQCLQEIFKPLFTTKPGSLGLGLALCRTIVEAHSGCLCAENRAGQAGAIMRLTLPAA